MVKQIKFDCGIHDKSYPPLVWASLEGPEGIVSLSYYPNRYGWDELPHVGVKGYNIDGIGGKGKLDPKTINNEDVASILHGALCFNTDGKSPAESHLLREYQAQFLD